jgi:hypothetical protein
MPEKDLVRIALRLSPIDNTLEIKPPVRKLAAPSARNPGSTGDAVTRFRRVTVQLGRDEGHRTKSHV